MVPTNITKVDGIGGIIKPNVIGTILLALKDNYGKIHKLRLENFYYFP